MWFIKESIRWCDGEIENKLTIKANKFSKTAIEKLEKSGSTIEVI